MLFSPKVCFSDGDTRLLVSKEILSTKIRAPDEYFKFLQKFGWNRELFDLAFPESSFSNCVNNMTLDTYKVKYKGRQGLVDGWFVQPKPGLNEKRAPLVIFNRGGLAKWGKLVMSDLLYFCQLAEHGYAVLASDFRGSQPLENSDRSILLDVTDLGYGDVYDSVDLIRLANEFGTIDSSKIALWGFSRGTMINALMLTKLENINAVVMVGTVARTDGGFRRGEFDEHVYPLIVKNWNSLSKTKQQNLLLGVSPIHLVDDIRSEPAFLFLHGAKDERTPANAMLEYVQALQNKQYKIELRLYSEGTHNLFKYQSSVMKEILDWLDLHLKE